MKKPRVKITASLSRMGDDKYNQDDQTMRFDFAISPLVPDSPVFRFMRYTMASELDKKNPHNHRKLIAAQLCERHRMCWERYHRWLEDE